MHGAFDGGGEVDAAHVEGVGGVLAFVDVHLFDDGAAFGVVFGELLEVAVEVGGDLVFGFGDEAEADFVGDEGGAGADEEGAAVPEGGEEALTTAELADAFGGPVEVVDFFGGGGFHAFDDFGVAGEEGLALVEGLGADFAAVVDAHEAGGFAPLRFGEVAFGVAVGGIRPLADGGGEEGFDGGGRGFR